MSRTFQEIAKDSPRFRGDQVVFGDGTMLVMPPLTLEQMETFEKDLALFTRPSLNAAPEVRDALVKVFYAAFARNYPDLMLAQLRDALDLVSMFDCYLAVAGVNQLRERAQKIGASP